MTIFCSWDLIKHRMIKGHIWVSNWNGVGSNPARSLSKNNEQGHCCVYMANLVLQNSQKNLDGSTTAARIIFVWVILPFRQDRALTPATFSFLIASKLSLCALLGIIFTDRLYKCATVITTHNCSCLRGPRFIYACTISLSLFYDDF